MENEERVFTGFVGQRRVARGGLVEVALRLKARVERDGAERFTLIDDSTGSSLAVSLDGTDEEVRRRLEGLFPAGEEEHPRRQGPGRPKLGVVSREVSLLPRHWEWLGEQPGGASATLRRLVDAARRESAARDRARRARDAVYRFLHEMAGDREGFEEAIRALYAGDYEKLERQMRTWPADIRKHALELAAVARERAEKVEASDAACKAR